MEATHTKHRPHIKMGKDVGEEEEEDDDFHNTGNTLYDHFIFQYCIASLFSYIYINCSAFSCYVPFTLSCLYHIMLIIALYYNIKYSLKRLLCKR